MDHVAIVTGGTRGIGAAISARLKAAGYSVAAVYARNDEAAQNFNKATGVPVYRWDVGAPRRSSHPRGYIPEESQETPHRRNAR